MEVERTDLLPGRCFPLRIFANKSSIIGESFLDHRGFEASHEINFKMI